MSGIADAPSHENGDTGLRKSNWIPWVFVGFFAVVFAVNGVMLTVALTTFNGLWTEGAYNRGLSYNETLAERDAQRALGWRVATEATHDDILSSIITLTAFDESEQPLPGVRIEAVARRPTSQQADFALDFRQAGRGLYQADVDWPMQGLWEVRATVHSGGDAYRLDTRLMVR